MHFSSLSCFYFIGNIRNQKLTFQLCRSTLPAGQSPHNLLRLFCYAIYSFQGCSSPITNSRLEEIISSSRNLSAAKSSRPTLDSSVNAVTLLNSGQLSSSSLDSGLSAGSSLGSRIYSGSSLDSTTSSSLGLDNSGLGKKQQNLKLKILAGKFFKCFINIFYENKF